MNNVSSIGYKHLESHFQNVAKTILPPFVKINGRVTSIYTCLYATSSIQSENARKNVNMTGKQEYIVYTVSKTFFSNYKTHLYH